MKITDVLMKSMNQTKFTLKKYSPEIGLGVGIVGLVGAGVLACRATLKVNTLLEESKETVEKINEAVEDPTKNYTEEDANSDLSIICRKNVIGITKEYLPSIVLAAASMASLILSHRTMKERNANLAAYASSLALGYKEYRDRVAEKYGKDEERMLYDGVKIEEIEETITDEKGKEKTVKKKVLKQNPITNNFYDRIYAEGCKGWTKNSIQNRITLKEIVEEANWILQTKGYLWLNDVYGMLGIPKTTYGHNVGWFYDPNNEALQNRVDFGLYDYENPEVSDFINGYTNSVLLRFNIDGDLTNLPGIGSIYDVCNSAMED